MTKPQIVRAAKFMHKFKGCKVFVDFNTLLSFPSMMTTKKTGR